MKISLKHTGKRFKQEWIFRNLDFSFEKGKPCAILGSNGSGKSTLLQVIAGSIQATEGEIIYTSDEGKIIAPEQTYCLVSFCSPYLELMEEFTFRESIRFQRELKPFLPGLEEKNILEISGLVTAADKFIKNYSSGMKQRAKLTLAVLSNAPVLLLDEPLTNLDRQGAEWYGRLIENYAKNKLVIVCSNQVKEEYGFCPEELRVEEWKKSIAS